MINLESKFLIRFKGGQFKYLRKRLLMDLSKEYFAVLLAKTVKVKDYYIIKIFDIRSPSAYHRQGKFTLELKKEFVYSVLQELLNRIDVDTLIDVHTHPFCTSTVSFSEIDNADEIAFFKFLTSKFQGLTYGSVVLSQQEYSARIWSWDNIHQVLPKTALIQTQTSSESIPSSDFSSRVDEEYVINTLEQKDGFFNRNVLVFNLETMRTMLSNQMITIVGIGGLGSIIAEHLVHMGFHCINLIDPDRLEMPNMNRIVGAYYKDALKNKPKVQVVKRHLKKINPHASIQAYISDIHEKRMEMVIALSTWLIVATDNHSSRLKTQELSIKYFVPLISAGVNISIEQGKVKDISGEVITARPGDYLCLNCLKRINPMKVAHEMHPDKKFRQELVSRGYVPHNDIKEPAVKTLNSIVATLTVDTLVNQYAQLQKHYPILVYENNRHKVIYEDIESRHRRNKNCFTCNI